MANYIDDEVRDSKFNNAQQATFDLIFGHHETKQEDEVEMKTIDFKFGTNVHWMDNARMTSNNEMAGIGEYNKMRHECNGYVVR